MKVLELKEIKLADLKKEINDLTSEKKTKQERVLVVAEKKEDTEILFKKVVKGLGKAKGIVAKMNQFELHVNGFHLVKFVCANKAEEWTSKDRSAVRSMEFNRGYTVE